ncbi:MAG: PLP-dependent aminotransferase family protein [Verrucomicrobia bacterium]|nr:MAG: PLP-dependent aminotransferase family protein [Verrucomicrobiota bacterium]
MKSSAFSKMGRRTQAPPISWLMKLALDHPALISLAAGFTDNESLPVAEARALLNEILGSRKTGRTALQYGTTVGDPQLRRLTAERLWQLDSSRGTRSTASLIDMKRESTVGLSPRELKEIYSPERAIITSGSQQLLYMLTECLCDPGDVVLVEDPTYFVYLSIVQSHGLQCRGVRLAGDGIDLAHLEQTLKALERSGGLKRVKMLYLVSYYQNPTGITTSFVKKVGALKTLKRFERAARHPIYLLEDAAYRELRFAGDDVSSALAVKGAADRVIYAGTYSKPFATGARVGFGILPEPLLDAVLRVKANHDFGTSNLLQQLLSRALASCRYEKHLSALRHRYARKAVTMVKAMREHFPADVRWEEPRGGLYVWARLPGSVKSGLKSNLFQSALRHGVLYVPGELCYADDPTRRKPNHEMRISFGSATEADIRAGITRLGATLRELL